VECPLTVLEVMALGKPLITTYIGAIPEIVHNDENGLLVNPRSKEIATAIGKLLLNRDLAIKLGNNAHKYVKKFHSWEHVIDQTARVFEESLS
jgi:glycosyltransferase involved in cell wall biosynthesis